MPKDNIVPVDVRKQYMQDMARYSLYALFERYVPDLRDGLKPVQRRILYCMWNDIKCVSKATKRKSLNTIGQVSGLYHPHGDCISGDTTIYNLDGTTNTIEYMYNTGIQSFESLGINETTLKIEPIIVHSLRIGQYTNKIYHIQLSNGSEIKCTSNHPIMLKNGVYIKAENIMPNMILNTRFHYISKSKNDARPAIAGGAEGLVQDIVSDFYNGEVAESYVKHHIDENKFNNTRSNLAIMSRGEHADLHHDYNKGLELGRIAMADPHSTAHAVNYVKNKTLMQLFNKDQNFRRFKYAIGVLKERGVELTIDNYESLRGTIYNLPKIKSLIKRGYGNSFEELLIKEVPTLEELYAEEVGKRKLLYRIINKNKTELEHYDHIVVQRIFFNNMESMMMGGLMPTYFNYLNAYPQWNNKMDENEFNILFTKFCNERPFVTNVYIEEVNNVPMYDFTVDTTHNMLIPFIGSNNINGEFPMVCMHNSSVYGAMQTLTNHWEIKEPLLNYDSSSGSIQGGPQAAARYTESYLSQFTMDAIMADLIESKMCVDWDKTFDGHTTEPLCLPVRVPLLLINGCFGVVIGRQIEVPKHSLNDVIDATLNVLHNPNAKVILIPDPCQKCEVVESDWKKISNMGFGYYIQRGIVEITQDSKSGIYTLHLRSMPDLVTANSVLDTIQKLIKDNKLPQISDIQDHSKSDELDIWLILKRGSDAEYVKQVLYKNTNIQSTKRVNMEVVDGNEIKRVSYKAYIMNFIEFRRTVKFRIYNARLQKVETRLHMTEIYISILESGDVENIIHAIRNQKPSEEAQLIDWLMKKLKITDLQAKFILNTEIKKLSKGNLNKYKEERKQLSLQRDQYIKMITTPELIDKEIEQELLDIKAKYGKPRKSVIISEAEASDIPQGTFKIVLYESNFIKKLQINDQVKIYKGDSVKSVIIGDNDKDILLFDEMGKVFRLPIHKIAFTDKNSPGIDIRMIIKKLTSNIVSVMYFPIIETLANKQSKYFIVVVTKNGLIKRMDLDDLLSTTPSGILYTKLNQGDFVKDIIIANHKSDVILYTKSKALRITIESIPYLKRSTLGSTGMKIKPEESIDGISVVTSDTRDVIIVTDKGRFNRISQSALERGTKGKTGVKVIKLLKGDAIHNIFTCSSNVTIHCIHSDGTFTDIQSNEVPMGSSVSSGEKLTKEIVRAELIVPQK